MQPSSTIQHNGDNFITLPLSIIGNFFDCHNLSESKQMLREIREQLFNRNYVYEQNSIEHDNVLYFFEKMEELIDAAHRINTPARR